LFPDQKIKCTVSSSFFKFKLVKNSIKYDSGSKTTIMVDSGKFGKKDSIKYRSHIITDINLSIQFVQAIEDGLY